MIGLKSLAVDMVVELQNQPEEESAYVLGTKIQELIQ